MRAWPHSFRRRLGEEALERLAPAPGGRHLYRRPGKAGSEGNLPAVPRNGRTPPQPPAGHVAGTASGNNLLRMTTLPALAMVFSSPWIRGCSSWWIDCGTPYPPRQSIWGARSFRCGGRTRPDGGRSNWRMAPRSGRTESVLRFLPSGRPTCWRISTPRLAARLRSVVHASTATVNLAYPAADVPAAMGRVRLPGAGRGKGGDAGLQLQPPQIRRARPRDRSAPACFRGRGPAPGNAGG